MNTPPLRPEQLSPKMSPIAFSLDDPNNNCNFQHLLASPTKLKLDGTNIGSNVSSNLNSNGNSLIYRTSLSKLSELSRTGRSRQRSNSDTLRSVSPIRFQLFNNAPKMLRPEYMSQQSSALPLLSTLMKQSTTASSVSGNSGNSSTQADIATKLGIRETLEQLQKEQKELQQKEEEKKQKRQKEEQTKQVQQVKKSTRQPEKTENKHKADRRKVSQAESATSGATLYDNSCDPNETFKSRPNKNNNDIMAFEEAPDVRVISNSSTIFSSMTVDLNDISKEMDIDLLPIDKNGFVQFGESKSNRCSFISSSSTDFDADWCNQQQVRNQEETSKLDYRIKQLEVEIDELKLQNEKLIQSITTSRTVEDKFMFDALQEIRASKQKAQRGMERKVQHLEKKVKNYRKVMKSLDDTPGITAASKMSSPSHTAGDSNKPFSSKRRIARISSLELRKIEEQGDSSGSSSEEEKDGQLQKHGNYVDSMLSKQLHQKNHTPSADTSIRRKTGFQLNIQLHMQGNAE